MKNKYLLFVIPCFISLLFLVLYIYERRSSYVCNPFSMNKEEIVKTCSKENFNHALQNDLLDSVVVNDEKGTMGIKISSYSLREEGMTEDQKVEECIYDITEKIRKGLNITETSEMSITLPVLLSRGLIAYNYDGVIYMQNYLEDTPAMKIVSVDFIKGTKVYNDGGGGYVIIGPYVHSYTSDSYIYFFTDYTGSCGDEAYCEDLSKMSEELRDKNLVGYFEYNIKTGAIKILK